MKQLLFIILFASLFGVAKADQLAWITLEQAEEATALLKKQSDILLWCACCDKDPKTILHITNISYKQVSDTYYQIIAEGVDLKGQKRSEEIDLAYVFIQKDDMAHCIAKVLKFECAPCTKPFKWALGE